MDIRPLNKRVLVAENKKEQTTTSGIIIEGARGIGDTTKATVLAIGPAVTDVNVGDVVLIEWNKAAPVKIGDVQRAMIDQDHIIAVVEG